MPLRWGIVTAGKISNDFVNAFNTYPQRGDQEIAAVAARSQENAEKFAKLHGIKQVFESYQAMAVSKDIGKLCTTVFFFFFSIFALSAGRSLPN